MGSQRCPVAVLHWLVCVSLLCQGTRSVSDEVILKSEHWSDNKRFKLMVDTRERSLTLQEVSVDGFATRWRIGFAQEEAPLNAHISNDGRFVVLRDQWAFRGQGEVLVFIGSKGQKLASTCLAL